MPKHQEIEEVPVVYPILDTDGLAQKLTVKPCWVRNHTQPTHRDPIPHLRLGRYVRFEWGSPQLQKWLERQRSKEKGR
jgi:hypothetical protein